MKYTTEELYAIYKSPQFKQWCSRRGMSGLSTQDLLEYIDGEMMKDATTQAIPVVFPNLCKECNKVIFSPQEECTHKSRYGENEIAHYEDRSVCLLCKKEWKEWPREEVEELTEDDFYEDPILGEHLKVIGHKYMLSEKGRDKLIRIINRHGKGEV